MTAAHDAIATVILAGRTALAFLARTEESWAEFDRYLRRNGDDAPLTRAEAVELAQLAQSLNEVIP